MKLLAIDVETTGLDTHRDDVIQIGLISIPLTPTLDMTAVSSFFSDVRPRRTIAALRDTVSHITGIDTTQLQTAPTREDISQQIMSHIDDQTIIIGHSVSFDLQMLSRYDTRRSTLPYLDTFTLSQSMIHFAKSYALEILHHNIVEHQPTLVHYQQQLQAQLGHHDHSQTAHNALHDCLLTLVLRHHLQQQFQTLITVYPGLLHRMSHYSSTLTRAISQLSDSHTSTGTLVLPVLTRPLSDTRPANHHQKIGADHSSVSREPGSCISYRIDGHSIHDIMHYYAGSKVMFAFSQPSKCERMKQHCLAYGITPGFLKTAQRIDPDLLKTLTQHTPQDDEHILFILQYLSQHYTGHSVIDTASAHAKRTVALLQMTVPPSKGEQERFDRIITTHGGLFALKTSRMDLDSTHYDDYQIVMMDSDRRHHSFNQVIHSERDRYALLEQTSLLGYVDQERHRLLPSQYPLGPGDELIQRSDSLCIMMGTRYIAGATLFTKHAADTRDIASLGTHPLYTHSYIIRTRLYQQAQTIAQQYPDHSRVQQRWIRVQHFDTLRDADATLVRKTYLPTGLYFTIQPRVRYSDFAELRDLLRAHILTMLSTRPVRFDVFPTTPSISQDSGSLILHPSSPISPIRPSSSIIRPSSFVIRHSLSTIQPRISTSLPSDPDTPRHAIALSGSKIASQGLVNQLNAYCLQHDITLIAENISGGRGKCIEKYRNSTRAILISGNHCAIDLICSGQSCDYLIDYHIAGALHDSIIDDIVWYLGHS